MGLLSLLFSAATPENPRFNLNDPMAWDTLESPPASSGQRVNREIAMTHSPWWRGVNLLASDVGKLPLFVIHRQNGVNVRARDHSAYFLLRRKPNDFQTSFTFRRQLTAHAVGTNGNGYAYINRRGGTPFELLPLDPDSTFPIRANGVLKYVVQINGEMRKLDPTEVLHIKGFSFDGLQGYNVVDKAREDLGLGIGARKFQSVFLRNNARPGVVLEMPGKLPADRKAQLREEWERMHAGIDQAHRTAILDSGLTAKTISFNAEDAQLIQTRQFGVRDIANWLGLPPHKLGDTTRVGYNSLEQEDQSYLDQSLDPWLVNWEEECWDKLLREEEKASDEWDVEFFRKALVRADLATRGTYYRTALGGNPWMEVNEVREEEGLDPVEGGEGIPKPKNMDYGPGQPPETAPAKPPRQPNKDPMEDDSDQQASAARGDLRAALGEALADGLGRMIRRISLDAGRASKSPGEFLNWLDALEKTHGAIVRTALDPLEKACRVENEAFGLNVSGWLLSTCRDKFLDLAGRCTPAQLPQGVIDLAAELDRLPGELLTTYLGGRF